MTRECGDQPTLGRPGPPSVGKPIWQTSGQYKVGDDLVTMTELSSAVVVCPSRDREATIALLL